MTTATERQERKVPALWQHQKDALAFAEGKPGVMLAMEMGTGKTRCAVEYIRMTGAKRVLVLAPLSIVDHVWEDQIREHSPVEMTVAALGQKYSGTAKKVKAAEAAMIQAGPKPAVVVVNYEATLQQTFRSWAERMKWDLLILDECHKLKSPTGKTSLWIGRLASRIPRRMALTGTPMPHSPLDIYAQYRALDPGVFGDSYHAFRDRYARTIPLPPPRGASEETPRKLETKGAKQVIGYKNLDELAERMGAIAFQVKSQDVQDLPPAHHFTYRTGLRPQAGRVYRQMEESFMAQLESGEVIHAENVLVQLLKLQQMTSGYYRDEEDRIVRLDRSKSKALEEILDAVNQDEPVVVFARFLEDLQEIRDTAEAAGREAFEYSGRVKELTPWKERGGVLAVQIQTGSVGVDMTDARYCVYYSLGFSWGDYEQSLKRVHREGQSRTVRYIHLIAADTVDEKVYQTLQRKEDIVRAIMDSRSLRPEQ